MFKRRHFREEDGSKPQVEIDAAVSQRANEETKKALIAIVIILLGVSSFFVKRMIDKTDSSGTLQAAELKGYADSIMAQHVKEMNPYLEQVRGQDASIKQISHDVQRLTDFFEFKFGMPHESSRRRNH